MHPKNKSNHASIRTITSIIAMLTISFLWVISYTHAQADQTETSYGVDVSYPMFTSKVHDHPTIGNRQEFYENYMQGCRDYWGKKGAVCDSVERDRIDQNNRQPKSMVNYTDTGYMKIKAPDEVFQLIRDFWEKNKDREEDEYWFTGNVYVNYWENFSKMVDIGNGELEGGGAHLKDAIWDASKDTIQKWTGQNLIPSSVYGIRVYKEGAVLATHVDRLPLISSGIINVAQDVDEPWPIEVIGHDGKAVNITMEPGDMVLYESHSILHGRPFPLKGRYFANVFIHFEPDPATAIKGVLPPYILEGSDEAKRWLQSNSNDNDDGDDDVEDTHIERHAAHTAAANGDLQTLKSIAKHQEEALSFRDENGWMPIHEAARSGHLHIIQYLVDEIGVDFTVRVNFGKGFDASIIAANHLGEDHPAVQYLGEMMDMVYEIENDAEDDDEEMGNDLDHEVDDEGEEKYYDYEEDKIDEEEEEEEDYDDDEDIMHDEL